MALVTKNFSDIITFSRSSGATWFNSAGILQGVDFSVTSNTIGTGSKSFTLTATAGVNRYWTAGDTVLISDQANSANNMVGTVTSYNASTQVLVCDITSTGGSGTITSWRIGSTMPRFDYDPSTLAAQGLLIEEARTNLLTYSEDFSDASWVKTDVTVTVDNTTAPAGTTTADLLTEGTAGTAAITRSASATVSAGATVTGSFFVKRSAVVQWIRVRLSNSAGTNGGNVWFDIQNGVLGNQTNLGSGTATSGTITLINNGWYRVTVTTTLAAGDTTSLLLFTSASANGSTTRVNNSAYWAWGAQLEAGAFPTSYIPTTTTALTRSADDARVNVLSPWYNQTAGTLFVERIQQPLDPVSARRYINICDGSTANSIQKYQATGGISAAVTAIGGVASFGPSPTGVPAQNSIVRTALSFDGISKSMCRDAGTVFTDAIASPTSGMTTMFIGSQLGTAGPAVQFSCTHIRRITYYPRRLSNAELVSITS